MFEIAARAAEEKQAQDVAEAMEYAASLLEAQKQTMARPECTPTAWGRWQRSYAATNLAWMIWWAMFRALLKESGAGRPEPERPLGGGVESPDRPGWRLGANRKRASPHGQPAGYGRVIRIWHGLFAGQAAAAVSGWKSWQTLRPRSAR